MLSLPQPARAAVMRVAASIEAEQLELHLEGLDSENDHNVVYSIYFDLPAELADDERVEDYFVGNLSFFGAKHHRDIRVRADAPLGLTHLFDVTALVNDLQAGRRWDSEKLTITFEPAALTTAEGDSPLLAETRAVPVATIGRVSLFRLTR